MSEAANYRVRHQAKCSHCGWIAEDMSTGNFISDFFLPNDCPGCGERMSSWNMYRTEAENKAVPHWRHVIRKQKIVRPVRTHNPFTWLRRPRWVDADVHDMRAR